MNKCVFVCGTFTFCFSLARTCMCTSCLYSHGRFSLVSEIYHLAECEYTTFIAKAFIFKSTPFPSPLSRCQKLLFASLHAVAATVCSGYECVSRRFQGISLSVPSLNGSYLAALQNSRKHFIIFFHSLALWLSLVDGGMSKMLHCCCALTWCDHIGSYRRNT